MAYPLIQVTRSTQHMRVHLRSISLVLLAALHGSALAVEPSNSSLAPAHTDPAFLADAQTCAAWTALAPTGSSPSGREGASAIFDAPRHRMIVFGGLNGGTLLNDVFSLDLTSAVPAWTALTTSGTKPSARMAHTAIYDPVRQRMIVYGGGRGGVPGDVWALSLTGTPTWTKLTPLGTPPAARHDHTAIYDPIRDRMLVFGGYDIISSTYYADTWALSLSGTPTWSSVVTVGTAPSARYGHAAIYDPVRDRMVIQGGHTTTVGLTNQVYFLALSGSPTWTQANPGGPLPIGQQNHTAVYDAPRDRMVIFGGRSDDSNGSPSTNATYALSLSEPLQWFQAVAASPPSTRSGHGAIYDADHERMVVFGGMSLGNTYNDLHALSFGGSGYGLGTVVSPAGSGSVGVSPVASCYAPGTVVHLTATPSGPDYVFAQWSGDASGTQNPIDVTMDGDKVVTAQFAFAPGYECQRWFESNPGPPAPSLRWGESTIFDPSRHRLVMFGGYVSGAGTNDVWTYDLAGSTGWTQLAASGTPPLARGGHSAIYDPVNDRMIVFGGNAFSVNRNDTWALQFSPSPSWQQLAPTPGPPQARSGHTAIYDPSRRRMVIFAGDGAGITVWTLSLGAAPAWNQLHPPGFPGTYRVKHTAIYDPPRDRMIVYGGAACDTDPCDDVWTLSFTGSPTWTELNPVGQRPRGRYAHMAAYDPQRDRMIVYGGAVNDGPDGAWTLELGVNGWKQLVTANSAPNSVDHPAIFDTIDESLVWYGGPVYELSFAGGLALSVIDGPGGHVSDDPSRRCYPTGSTVSLTATPYPLWGTVFYRWRGDAHGNTNPLTLTMTDHMAIVAEFVQPNAVPDSTLDFGFFAAAPNPTSASTRIDYALPHAAFVRLTIVDIAGREVAQLVRSLRDPGRHSATWDGLVQEHRASAGVYFARLEAGPWTAVRRIVLVP